MTPERVREHYLAACETELLALKPGNVHVHAGGHHMSVGDFRAAAVASAPHITDVSLSQGERIFRAIDASRKAVPLNTNLGIVLLCVPLAEAAMACEEQPTQETMRAQAAAALGRLDRNDAAWAFKAIALASPGGLGEAAEHDVRKPATVALVEAMKAAADRDRIAAQYAYGFFDVFNVALPPLNHFLMHSGDEAEAASRLYLFLLATVPDSHLVRKAGQDRATLVLLEAKSIFKQAEGLEAHARRERLLAWDSKLKAEGLNPGTTADLTVATLFLRNILGDTSRQR